jgi:hypothetical protein
MRTRTCGHFLKFSSIYSLHIADLGIAVENEDAVGLAVVLETHVEWMDAIKVGGV